MEKISNADLEMHIIGSGALTYSWWRAWRPEYDYDLETNDAPEDWAGVLVAENPKGPGRIQVDLNGPAIRAAVNKIARGGVKDLNRIVVAECRNLLWHPDDADLDADAADQVLQVIAFGEVVYG